jgi:methionyl-tRNA formyltransferase
VKAAPASIERLVYLGTPALAVPPLEALHDAGFDIPLVVTNPDKRRGRGRGVSPSPVKQAALKMGLDVSHDVSDVLDVAADIGVVVAFGRLINPEILDALAMVNIHFSLLPRWRGAAPVERALLEGDAETGICLMGLEEALDTGPIYRRIRERIRDDDTLHTLRDRLVELSGPLLVSAFAEGLGVPRPQVGEATYARKLDPSELQIDWSVTAAGIERLTRLGGAWTDFRGKRLRIWSVRHTASSDLESGAVLGDRVGTGSSDLVFDVVQPEGKAQMNAAAWLNGAHMGPDERLG